MSEEYSWPNSLHFRAIERATFHPRGRMKRVYLEIWAARTFWHLTLDRSGRTRGQSKATAAARVAREIDCLFRRLYASETRAPWRGPKWIGRLCEAGWEVVPLWKRESIRGSKGTRGPIVFLSVSRRGEGTESGSRESGKGEPTAVKAFAVSFWPDPSLRPWCCGC